MQPAQPDWNATKLGNNADQWGIYDDNDNGRHIATVTGARAARLIEAAPKMLALLADINEKLPWSRKMEELLRDIKSNDSLLDDIS